ncbi:hypothetical protein PR003_g14498 [Phytophthora rubi]|uniref:HTH CENPB-type domain-containing protein n=1 Tax=Phytophthora rubi TaxID=129364 RepID=A0A6A3KY09_9STRA|nr:hypothetical protein PR001_g16667 [Phytophthora rubi]KAE9011469.1 hypothetical protein PR002_g15071 [Phytophthora rubi]KAE9332487.1 hypothetical protein PR003_g14498 [Phytophthora rubi]
MRPSPQPRTRLTRLQKQTLCQKAHDSPGSSYKQLAEWAQDEFGLAAAPHKGTICRVLKAHKDLRMQRSEFGSEKKKMPAAQLQLDENVVEFVMLAELEGICLSGDMIIFYAQELAHKLRIPVEQQPRYGRSWLRRLQCRYGFRWRRSYDESSSTNLSAAKDDLEKIKRVVASYKPRDVFNMDESAFFHNTVPRGSICKTKAPALKQSKARVTMACCANADGTEKLPLLFLGTAEKPRWYKKKPHSLQYMGTSKGWMTTWMYQQWLVHLEEEMAAKNRHILLLVDNASSHGETGLCLKHIRVEKLPPNTTAKIQPIDQGIIFCVKREVLNQKMIR